MTELNQIFSKNLSALRQQNNMTQAELAEQLNYSDKSVSKWERGESVPDVAVLQKISAIFGVSLDALLTDAKQAAEPVVYARVPTEKERYAQHMNILTIVLTGVWLLALAVFIGLWAGIHILYWKLFIYMLPLTFLLLIIFTALWGRHKIAANAVNISMFILSLLLSIFIGLLPGKNVWMIFLLMIPVEIIVGFSFRLYADKKKRKDHAAEKDKTDHPDAGDAAETDRTGTDGGKSKRKMA